MNLKQINAFSLTFNEKPEERREEKTGISRSDERNMFFIFITRATREKSVFKARATRETRFLIEERRETCFLIQERREKQVFEYKSGERNVFASLHFASLAHKKSRE